ncbi:MAG: hypothetical protein AB9873_04960 [Syntrophobacteraceae bacterium]
MTMEGDLVLVYADNQPAFFARIEAITADFKPEWYQVKMLVLQVPVALITWILREPYINGDEFTMGGRPIRMEKVIVPEEMDMELPPSEPLGHEALEVSEEQEPEPAEKEPTKVVSLADRRKKK